MEKSILITNFQISEYSGSEINAATIAKRFKQKGYKVYMLAMFFEEPLYSNVKDDFDEIINITENKFDFSKIEFDIVWAHHSFLLNWLICEYNIKAKKVIISSLSGKEIFEAVPLYSNELSMILANSEETKEVLEKEGLENIRLLENYSFKEYFDRKIKVKELKNIAIVSNHVPQELHEVKEKLINNGYNVEIYGVEGKRQLITDKVLENYDVIITIGKTVQYAMSLKIPVYVYDIFGGEGYLTLENLEKNRKKNFSGRGFDKKTSEQIYNEIINNFKENLLILEDIKEYAQERFCFEQKVDNILEELDKLPNIDLDNIRKKYIKNERELLAARQMYRYMKTKNNQDINRREEEFLKLANKLKDEIKSKDMELENVKKQLQDEKQKYKRIVTSKSWKFTCFIRKVMGKK